MFRSDIAAAVALSVSLAFAACGGDEPTTAYVGATVFDGSGAPPILDANIVVVGGRIEQVGPPDLVKVPRGAMRIRVDGKWVIPGLIDSHVHVARWTLPRYLAYGVTSVRSMGGYADTVAALRDSVQLGSLLGPRIYASGPMIDGAPATWPSATPATDATAGRRAVDQRVLSEFSHVKVYSKLDRRLLAAVIDEAKAFELPVAAHLGKVDAVSAARMGVSSIEHLSGVVEATLRNPAALLASHDDFFRGWKAFERAWTRLDSARLEQTAIELVDAGAAIVPTLALHEVFGHLADQDFISELDLSGVPQAVRDEWDVPDLIRRARLATSDFRAFRRARPVQDLFVRRFRAAEGLVVAGSDSPNQLLAPGASLHRELELLVQAGLSTEEALLAATRDAARLIRVDSVGSILPGQVADFVVLMDSPLDDITHIRLIERVVYRGTSYHPDHFKSEW
jgi:imidazolonepropionase-like amidohydrolase